MRIKMTVLTVSRRRCGGVTRTGRIRRRRRYGSGADPRAGAGGVRLGRRRDWRRDRGRPGRDPRCRSDRPPSGPGAEARRARRAVRDEGGLRPAALRANRAQRCARFVSLLGGRWRRSRDVPPAEEPRCDEDERRGVRREDERRLAACDERARERARASVADVIGRNTDHCDQRVAVRAHEELHQAVEDADLARQCDRTSA